MTQKFQVGDAEVSGPYRIDEYDGYESVNTPEGYDWIIP